MQVDEYLLSLSALGWIVAGVIAALVTGLPGMSGRRHAGWLIGFCAARVLTESQGFGLSGSNDPSSLLARPEWRQVAAILGGMLLWEFARRVWNDQGRRRIPGVTHLPAAEGVALVTAVTLAANAPSWPEWFLPVAVAIAILPALLGGGSAWLLWRCLDRSSDATRFALRVAVLGLGLYGVFQEVPSLSLVGLVSPWLVVGGLGAACLALPTARTRFALVFAAGLMLAPLTAPLAAEANLRRVEAAERDRMLTRGEQASAGLQGRLAARLGTEAKMDADTLGKLRAYLENLRASDSILSTATLCELRGGRVWTLDPGAGFNDTRAATARERQGAQLGHSFFIQGSSDAPSLALTVFAPVRAARFESPTAWLVLEYPGSLWEAQRQSARRDGVALVGLFAVFCATGFALACRQAMENAERLHLERTEAASSAKTEFLAFLSHELRTPLQTVLGRADLLRRTELDLVQTRHIEVMAAQGQILLRLVTDLLDLGTIEAGKLELKLAPFSLRTLLAALEEAHGPVAALKDLTLSVEIDHSVPDALVGDGIRLRQILGNLLSNAVKYTLRGEVRLTVTAEAAETNGTPFIFRVTDTGPGLPPKKISQLFTLFTRLDRGGTFTREGTGVGLALVQRLCALMGGNVSAANRPAGGAEFTVRIVFPFAKSAEADASAQGVIPASGTLAVLVGEDNTAGREFLVEALGALGHRVEAVSDGEAVLTAYSQRAFDAVVLDVNLPGRDGIAVARVLAACSPRPRIIGCSAEAFAHTRAAALAAGMDAFLEKPASLAALAATLTPGESIALTESGNLFERLRSPLLAARARDNLARELPAELECLTSLSHKASDLPALQRKAHYLRSSALLAGETALAEVCQRIEHASMSGDISAVTAIVAEAAHATRDVT